MNKKTLTKLEFYKITELLIASDHRVKVLPADHF